MTEQYGLMVAAFIPDLATVRRLLESGADPNESNDGHTVLMEALQEPEKFFDDDSYAVVKLLIEAGADVDAADREQRTPLHFAVCPGPRAVALLLDAGANPNLKDADGLTPLHECVNFSAAEVARQLLAAGADPSARDGDGKTAYERALLDASEHPEDEDAVALRDLLGGATAP